MTTRTMVALLLAGSAFFAAPAWAQSAPLNLPSGLAPVPTPQIDPDNKSRGPFGLDPAQAIDGLATQTLNRDGSVTETPASEGLRDIFLQETKGAVSVPAGSTGPTDERTQIRDGVDAPYNVFGILLTEDKNGQQGFCSATLIGPFTVLTAAHCVYENELQDFNTKMLFVPGAVDDKNAPFGLYDWANVNVLKGFVSQYDGTYSSVVPWDLAVITLEKSAGPNKILLKADDGSTFNATLTAYPGDKPLGTMWSSTCTIPPTDFDDFNFAHHCDSYAGTSGGSMYETAADGKLYVRGLNIAEDDPSVPVGQQRNYGIRITATYLDWIMQNYK